MRRRRRAESRSDGAIRRDFGDARLTRDKEIAESVKLQASGIRVDRQVCIEAHRPGWSEPVDVLAIVRHVDGLSVRSRGCQEQHGEGKARQRGAGADGRERGCRCEQPGGELFFHKCSESEKTEPAESRLHGRSF